ncbi:MAG TPA: 7TM-DISM domain-containing protein [Cyclobacteriaceae bacterium]|nr:7TM-DISM domain-containing protein [Cyclobacteriaceae bacterium]
MKASSFVILFCLSFRLFAQQNDIARATGVIDGRQWDMNKKSLALNGFCRYFENQLLSPAECKTGSGVISEFPSLFKSNGTEEGIGYATYLLTVVIPHGEKEFALAIPQIYSSYKLWVNGKVIGANGVVAKTKEACTPQWRPQTVSFECTSDTLSLVLQVANFHHAKGGIKENIFLGKVSSMTFKRTVSEVSKFAESASLFALGLFFLIIYFIRGRNKACVYFALLGITWATRSLFSNLYLFISLYPDFDWTMMVRIEYVALYLAMIWAVLFLTSLFHNEANIVIKYGLVFCNIIFTGFSLYSAPRVFTQGLSVYLIASGILLLYGAYIVIRAWINERTGSGLLTLSVVLGLNIFGADIFVYEGFSSYDPVIFSTGYVLIFLMMGLALATHINLIKSGQATTTTLTYDDLYKDHTL